MIKKIIFVLILINSKFLFAQSNNEYLFDLSAINPAAIVVESSSISLFHSKKLSGIKDAPLTQNIRWNNSFGESNAIALNVQSLKKGVSGIILYEFSYAFTAKVFQKNKLTLGLSSSLNTVYIDESLLVSGSDNDNLNVSLDRRIISIGRCPIRFRSGLQFEVFFSETHFADFFFVISGEHEDGTVRNDEITLSCKLYFDGRFT